MNRHEILIDREKHLDIESRCPSFIRHDQSKYHIFPDDVITFREMVDGESTGRYLQRQVFSIQKDPYREKYFVKVHLDMVIPMIPRRIRDYYF